MTRHLITALFLLLTLAALAASQVATPTRVRVGSTQMADQIVKKVAPEYPPLARQARIQGSVILKVQINKSGDVVNLQLFSGHPMLAPAALEAVKQWKYKPFLLNGDPVEVETNVTVNFTLADEPAAEGVAGDFPGDAPSGQANPQVLRVVPSNEDTGHLVAPQRVRVSSGVAQQRLLLSKVQPQYPQDAKDQHIQGVVVLQVIIDKEGNVAHIQLISGHPQLAPAALEAVKQWKYRPYLLNGNLVEVDTQVQVNFTLMP